MITGRIIFKLQDESKHSEVLDHLIKIGIDKTLKDYHWNRDKEECSVHYSLDGSDITCKGNLYDNVWFQLELMVDFLKENVALSEISAAITTVDIIYFESLPTKGDLMI